MVAELKGFEVSDSGRTELCDVTAGIGRVRGALDALEVRVTAAVDALDDDGADAESMIRSKGRVSKREAARRARRAKKLKNMPNVADKLANGDISAEHADELAKAAEATSEELVDRDDLLLANAANRPADMAGRDIRDWVRKRQSNQDRETRHRAQRERRSVQIFVGDDDMTVAHCRTDTVTGEQLRVRIQAVAEHLYRQDGGRDGPSPRTWDQLRHDALMIICGINPAVSDTDPISGTGIGTDGDDVGTSAARSGSGRNQVVVVVDGDLITGTNPGGRCEIPGVGPLPASVLDRLMCDADIYGHIFAGNGTSLWHSRATRTVSAQQRRALIARDRGCVICGANPSYCEAHHIVPWRAGGLTDIENLALVCSRHHHQLHDHDQTLIRGPDNTWHTRPRAGPTTPTRQQAAA